MFGRQESLRVLLMSRFANAFVILGWLDAVGQHAALRFERVGACR